VRKFRLGLYDALDHSKRVRLMRGEFSDTPRDCRIMQLSIRYFNEMADHVGGSHLSLGIFPARRRTPAGRG
jgi:hypothetical protein